MYSAYIPDIFLTYILTCVPDIFSDIYPDICPGGIWGRNHHDGWLLFGTEWFGGCTNFYSVVRVVTPFGVDLHFLDFYKFL